MIPTRKISLTLIEFAQPLIESLRDGYSQTEMEGVLKLATCVWNACVLDMWHKSSKNVAALRQQISRGDPSLGAIIEALIERKGQMFGNDPRGITGEAVIVKNGEFVVRAEARLDVENLEVQSRIN